MAKPFDATTRLLTQGRPDDWVAFLGLPTGTTTLLDADLSTVSLAADRLVRVDVTTSPPYILHLEFESGKNTGQIPFRLLHKASDSPQITERYEEIGPDGRTYLTFGYRVVRVSTENVEKLLTGGLSLLPLAPVADVTPAQLPSIIQRIEARVDSEITDDNKAGEFWTATYILLGLRYDKAFNARLLQGVRRMKESVTYQAIVEEGVEKGIEQGIEQGRLTEARRLVLRAATRRLGEVPKAAQAVLEAVSALETLEMLHDRVFEVETWDELLSGAA